MTNALRHIHPDDSLELLSAYLDGELDVVERRRADELLRDCGACVAELHELRLLRQALRALPAPLPRRSFTLDPAAVRPRMRLFPVLRFASLVSALLLVVILGVDIFGGAGTPPQAASVRAPAAAPVAEPVPELAAESVTEGPLAAQEDAPAAGGAAPEPTEEVMAAAGAAVASTQAAAVLASAVPELAEGAARKMPEPSPTQSGAGAEQSEAGAAPPAEAVQNAMPADQTAPEADALLPGSATEAYGGAGGSSVLTKSDTSSFDTATLEAHEQPADAAPAEQPGRRWRLAELILASLVVVLGGASWWAARQQL
jgi:predicted anti-sigma-YlaC factor YlaD